MPITRTTSGYSVDEICNLAYNRTKRQYICPLGEQNVTFALPHADRVYVLEHARIVWEGEPAKFAVGAGTGYL
jgi:ABC-type branched-subunit amino acid transport system ATPase component